jgi:hypothetical protein
MPGEVTVIWKFMEGTPYLFYHDGNESWSEILMEQNFGGGGGGGGGCGVREDMWFHVTIYLLEKAGSGHFCVILYGSVCHCFLAIP